MPMNKLRRAPGSAVSFMCPLRSTTSFVKPNECGSSPKSFALEPLIKRCDVFRITVEQQRRATFADADQLFARLTPARMRHLRIDVGPEAVLGSLQGLPKGPRPLVSEHEMRDRFDRLETVLPRHRKTKRRALRLRHRLAVGPGYQEREFVGGFPHSEALDIRPRIPARALA